MTKPNIDFIKDYCKHLTLLTKIPFTLFSEKSILQFTTMSLIINEPTDFSFSQIVSRHLPLLNQLTNYPNYITTEDHILYGAVKIPVSNEILVIGPTTLTPFEKNRLHTFFQNNYITQEYYGFVQAFLSSLPIVNSTYFLELLLFVHFELTGESLEITKHFASQLQALNLSPKEYTKQEFFSKEEAVYHNSYYFEEALLNAIEAGDVETLRRTLTKSIPESGNILVVPALRQSKNDFISTLTLVTRSAIRGGMDMESAYQLSDAYIKKVEDFTTVEDIQIFYQSMLMDFANRVSKEQITFGMSKEMYSCIQYINQHINMPITVEDVAKHIHRSRSYTSTNFKKELGFNLNSYIMSRRLEEAKRLLLYTDMSLSEISAYLCFSSQAHFQTAFKKKYNMTPNQFRKH